MFNGVEWQCATTRRVTFGPCPFYFSDEPRPRTRAESPQFRELSPSTSFPVAMHIHLLMHQMFLTCRTELSAVALALPQTCCIVLILIYLNDCIPITLMCAFGPPDQLTNQAAWPTIILFTITFPDKTSSCAR